MDREFPKYVNVYELSQRCGGREEGGWYYDVGSPLESIRVDNEDELNKIKSMMLNRYELDEDGKYTPHNEDDVDRGRIRGRTSCAGGYDIEIFVEYKFAEFFPQEKPIYE